MIDMTDDVKYIKLFGTHGSGKTTLVRKLSEALTGQSCDFWIPIIRPDGIIKYNTCACGRFIAMGTWNEARKCCGVDAISSQKDFRYADRLETLSDTLHQYDTIFDDGVLNASKITIDKLSECYNMYPFHLSYPPEICFQNIITRGGNLTDKYKLNIINKIKSFNSTYKNITNNQKQELSGTIEENINNIIKIANLKPCNCFKNIL